MFAITQKVIFKGFKGTAHISVNRHLSADLHLFVQSSQMTCVAMHVLSMVQGSGMRSLFMYLFPSDLVETDLINVRIMLIIC